MKVRGIWVYRLGLRGRTQAVLFRIIINNNFIWIVLVFICIFGETKTIVVKSKKYVIESKGFREGIGSSSYRKKRDQQMQDLQKQIEAIKKVKKEIENL